MHVSKTVLATALVGALSFGGAALAQTGNTNDSSAMQQSSQSHMNSMSKPSAKDMDFARKASAANLTEIKSSELVDSHSQSEAVKNFAQTMIQDHTKAEDQLKEIAQQENLTIPDAPMSSQQKMISKLQGLNGSAFDKAYSKDMLKGHKQAVKLFKKESSHGKNDKLKGYATQTLPTFEHHLEMAKQLPDNGGKSMMSGKSDSDSSGS